MSKKVGILALQGAVREHVRAVAELDAHPVEVRTVEDLSGVDALILPGGESTTMSLLLESTGLFEPVAARLAEGMPAFGTCAGMILLASDVLDGRPDQRFFGAIDLTVRRNAFGRQVDSFETDLDLVGISDGGPVRTAFIRAPWIEEAGRDVEVLARIPAVDTQGRPVAAAGRIVAARQGPLLATAFHPEITGDTRVHGLFVGMVAGG